MTSTLLSVEDLSWAPPDSDRPIFSGVRFEIAAGERVVLEGPSGAGKSTLLRCIVGLEPKRGGAVFWRGERVGAETVRRFRSQVVYVHQRPSEVAETVGENLAFARTMAASLAGTDAGARPPLDRQAQRALCDELGLDRMSFSRRFDDLSVGEQQRVCLVRALTGRPDMLLLDEPTSALDPARVEQIEQRLIDYVDQAPDRRAFLWVSHQPRQIDRIATRVIDLGRWTGGEPNGGSA